MKKTLLYTLLVMLFALVGCEEFESLGFAKKKTDWNEVCAKARIYYGNGDAYDEIDKHASIYYAAWNRCNHRYDDADEDCIYFCLKDRERQCGTKSGDDETGNDYGRDNRSRYNRLQVMEANKFCNTVLGRNENWREDR